MKPGGILADVAKDILSTQAKNQELDIALKNMALDSREKALANEALQLNNNILQLQADMKKLQAAWSNFNDIKKNDENELEKLFLENSKLKNQIIKQNMCIKNLKNENNASELKVNYYYSLIEEKHLDKKDSNKKEKEEKNDINCENCLKEQQGMYQEKVSKLEQQQKQIEIEKNKLLDENNKLKILLEENNNKLKNANNDLKKFKEGCVKRKFLFHPFLVSGWDLYNKIKQSLKTQDMLEASIYTTNSNNQSKNN